MTDQKITVTQALSAVMAEMPGIGKDRKADPKQGGYAYRGIEDITTVLQPLFARHGIITVPHAELVEIKDITVNEKPWTDTILSVSYTIYGPAGDCISAGPIIAIGRDNSDKGSNKGLTQAYKYLLLQLLCISDGDDEGDAASVAADAPRRRALASPVASTKELEALKARIEIVKSDEHGDELLTWWKDSTLMPLNSLSSDQVTEVHHYLDMQGWAMDASDWGRTAPSAPKEATPVDFDQWRARFFARLDKLGLDKESRGEMVSVVSDGKFNSTKDLTPYMRGLIDKELDKLDAAMPSSFSRFAKTKETAQ